MPTGYAPGDAPLYNDPRALDPLAYYGLPQPNQRSTAPVAPGPAGPGYSSLPQSPNTQIYTPAINVPNYGNLSNQSSANIASLLNPTDFSDVQRRAAEHAMGGGFAGSGMAASEGTRLTEEERIRRMLLGEQALSGAVGRQPNPIVLPGTPQQQGGYAPPGGYSPVGNGGVVPGGFSLGSGRPPVQSPGNAANPILRGTPTPQANDWLQTLIGNYSPQTPAYQMRSGVGQQFQADQNPDITGPEGWMGPGYNDPQYGEDPNYQPVYTGQDDWSWLDDPNAW